MPRKHAVPSHQLARLQDAQAQTLMPQIVRNIHGHIQQTIFQRPCRVSIATIPTHIAQRNRTMNVTATILQHCKLCLDLCSFSRRRSHVSQCVCGSGFEEERRGSVCGCSCWGRERGSCSCMKASSSASLRGLYCGQWSAAGQHVDLHWEGYEDWG